MKESQLNIALDPKDLRVVELAAKRNGETRTEFARTILVAGARALLAEPEGGTDE